MLEKEDQTEQARAPEADLETLLAERDFVLTLARRMVSSSEAEDLAQDVWLAALRRPPSDVRRLRGWLARVTRNLAVEKKRARGLRSAAEAEKACVREPGGPSAFDEVSASAVARAVTEEVLQLREPYRGTLLAHYYERLAPAEIALRSGESVETVRTRLKRGIALLRQRLDVRHRGDARSSLEALLAWWSATPPPPPAWTAAERHPRGRKLVGLASLGALALVAGLGIAARLASDEAGALGLDAAHASAPPVALADPDADGAGRHALVRTLGLRIVRREDDTPVADAVLLLELGRGVELRARSDGEGRARFSFSPGNDVLVRVERSPTSLPHGELLAAGRFVEDTELTLRVPGASAIEGVVRDRDGRAVAGAVIRARAIASSRRFQLLAGPDELELTASSDAAGRFALGGLPGDFLVTVVGAGPRVGAEGVLAHLEHPTSVGGLELCLVEPREIRGRVVGPGDRPLEGALVRTTGANDASPKKRPGPHPSVTYLAHQESRATTDPHGSFTLAGLAPGLQTLSVQAAGFACAERIVPPEESWVPIELEPGARLAFQVFGADRQPRGGVHVQLHVGAELVLEGLSDERGLAEFAGLEPARTVHVRAFDDRHAVFARLHVPTLAAGGASPIRIDLSPARTLSGRVLDATGTPAPGAELVFRRAAIPDPPQEGRSFWNWRESMDVARFLQRARSGPDGRFEVAGLAEEPIEIEFTLAGLDAPRYRIVSREEREVLLQPRSDPASARVTGRLIAGESGLPLGADDAPTLRALESAGAMRRCAAEIRADGTFELPLPARGAWTLEFRARGRVPRFEGLLLEGDLERGDIALHGARALHLRVVDRLGAPLDGARLAVEELEGGPVPMPFGKWTYGNLVTLGTGGDAFLHDLPACPLRLRVWSPGARASYEERVDPTLVPADAPWTWRIGELELGRTLRSVPLAFDFGDPAPSASLTIRARALDTSGRSLADWTWERSEDGSLCATSGIEQRKWYMNDAGVFLTARDQPLERERYAGLIVSPPVTRAPTRDRVEIDLPLATVRVVVQADGFQSSTLDARAPETSPLHARLFRAP